MVGAVKSFGPHQSIMCFGSVQACQTRSMGASKTRVMTKSDTLWESIKNLLSLPLNRTVLFCRDKLVQCFEPHRPKRCQPISPIFHLAHFLWIDFVDALLRLFVHQDQVGFTKNFKVLGDGGMADRELFADLGGGHWTVVGKQLDNAAPVRVTEGRKFIHAVIIQRSLN